jgi:hypothetical protein
MEIGALAAAPLGAADMTAKPTVATAHADAVANSRDRNFEFLIAPLLSKSKLRLRQVINC